MITDLPDPTTTLCAALQSLLATPPESPTFPRRRRLARRLLDQHPELRLVLVEDQLATNDTSTAQWRTPQVAAAEGERLFAGTTAAQPPDTC